MIFSARTEADVIDRDRFEAWQARHPQCRSIRTLTRGAGPLPHGRIPELLPTLYQNLDGHDVFIAGAPAFVLACAAAADTRGAPRARVHTEVFFAEPQPWSGAAPKAEKAGVSTMSASGTPPIYTKTGDDGSTSLLFGGACPSPIPSSRFAGHWTRRSPPSAWRGQASHR